MMRRIRSTKLETAVASIRPQVIETWGETAIASTTGPSSDDGLHSLRLHQTALSDLDSIRLRVV